MDKCKELATTLSNNFRNTDPFHSSANAAIRNTNTTNTTTTTTTALSLLAKYLTNHGILFTMCFPNECTISFGATHISGSWINQHTGIQAIPTQSNIGLILDPTKVDIQCLYPTDAFSDMRDQEGCGPPQMDPNYGSKGASSFDNTTKELVRSTIQHYKNINFGIDTDWEDISCESFFGIRHPPGQSLPTRGHKAIFNVPYQLSWRRQLLNISDSRIGYKQRLNDDNTETFDFNYQTLESLSQDQYEAIMGHPVCKCEYSHFVEDNTVARELQPPPGPDPGWVMLVHQGPESWHPMEWQAAMDIQLQFIQQDNHNYTEHLHLNWRWNEIVMGLPPRQMQDLVMAIFYLNEGSHQKEYQQGMAKARAVAKIFGGKPVMTMNLKSMGGKQKDILTCSNEDNDIVRTTDPTTAARRKRRLQENAVDSIRKGREAMILKSLRLFSIL